MTRAVFRRRDVVLKGGIPAEAKNPASSYTGGRTRAMSNGPVPLRGCENTYTPPFVSKFNESDRIETSPCNAKLNNYFAKKGIYFLLFNCDTLKFHHLNHLAI
jgi:hypothetical protein